MEELRKNGRIDITLGITEDKIKIDELELQGARNKFWFNNWQYLFKEVYLNSYEDYAELISEEIAKIFEIPCAFYDLAIYNSKFGIVTKNFVDEENGEELIPGTEIIQEVYQKHIIPLKQTCEKFYNILTEHNITPNIDDFSNLSLTEKQNILEKCLNLCRTSNIKNKKIDSLNNTKLNEENSQIIFNEYVEMFNELSNMYNFEIIKGNNDELKLNNLFDLWSILQSYCTIIGKDNHIADRLIKDLSKIFIYDIITLQGDRHADNWGVIINHVTGDLKISPLYDNSNMCNLNRTKALIAITQKVKSLKNKNKLTPKDMRIKELLLREIYHNNSVIGVNPEDRILKSKNLEMINQFITISSQESLEYLLDKIDILLANNMENIFTNIELKTKVAVPQIIKDITIISLKLNIEEIRKVVSEKEKKNNVKQ